MTVTIDGVKLTIEGVVRVARLGANGRYEKATLSAKAREKISTTRAFIDQNWMHDDAPLMYSFNTLPKHLIKLEVLLSALTFLSTVFLRHCMLFAGKAKNLINQNNISMKSLANMSM